MPDNWTFVAAAYGLAAVVFGGYWRWLGKKERELTALTAKSDRRDDRRPRNDRTTPDDRTTRDDQTTRDDRTSRSHALPRPAHPRPEPGSSHSLQ
jgi:hypothetical protein